MKTFNTIFKDIKSLDSFININEIADSPKTLIQVYTGIVEIEAIRDIFDCLKKLMPLSKIIGSSTAGEIIDGKVLESTTVVSFMTFEKSSIETIAISDKNFKNAEEIIRRIFPNTKLIIAFSDGSSSKGEDIIKIVEKINNKIVVAGGMAGDNFRAQNFFIFNEVEILSSGVVLALIHSDSLSIYNNYSLCWQGIGKIMTVTDAEKNVLRKIDNQVAIDIYKKYIGGDITEKLLYNGSQFFPLIIKKNNMEIARIPLKQFEDGTIAYNASIEIGDKVQFGYGNVNIILNNSINILKGMKDLKLDAIIVFSCATRKTLLKKNIEFEIEPFKDMAPSVGFFTYGEFFHKDNKNESLSQTMVLIGLSESEEKSLDIGKSSEINYDFLRERTGDELEFIMIRGLSHLVDVTTTELNQINLELQNSIKNLKMTQDYLIVTEKMASLGKLASGIAHEINSPLGAILTNAQLMGLAINDVENQQIKSELAENIELIDLATKKAKEIISKLLKYTERSIAEFKNIKIQDILEYALENLKVDIAREGIEIIKNIDASIYIQGSFSELLNGMKIVLSNAIDALKECNRPKELKIISKQDNKIISIEIIDNGIGMDENTRVKIFDPFFTTKKLGNGMGLGLTVFYEIIKRHNGEVFVNSELDKGTSIRVVFNPIQNITEETK